MSQRATGPTRYAAADGARAPTLRIGTAMHRAGLAERIAAPQTMEEVEERYVASRNAWVAAMRAASSGRPADMATLAICQEAYESATLERERWLSGSARVALPIGGGSKPIDRASIEVVVDQALAWRDLHQHEQPRGLLGRLFGRRDRR